MNSLHNVSSPPLRDCFFARLTRQTNVTDNSVLENMGSSLNTRLEVKFHRDQNMELGTTGALHAERPELSVCTLGSPCWSDERLQKLALERGQGEALCEAYLSWGERLVERVSGAFALLVVDRERNQILAVTDKLSRYPIYFSTSARIAAVASTLDALAACNDGQKTINPQGIYNYVYFHMVPSPSTIYKDYHKLQAANVLVIKDGTAESKCYWTPGFHETTDKTLAEQAESLRSILEHSVQRATSANLKTGAFLSGGLDSSTVAGYLASHPETKAYSIGFSAEGYDEMAYARISARHFGIPLEEYYVTPTDVVEKLPLIAAGYDEPFGNSSALPAYFCALHAVKDGTGRLLAGDGGDELFAGNDRYAKQQLFELYHHAPRSLRTKLVEPLLGLLPTALPLLSKAKSYVEQANTPLPDRLQSYNFLHRHDPKAIFSSDFLNSCSHATPINLLRDVYQRPKSADSLNRMLYTDWQFTLADNDLRKVSGMCALAGVEVAYPMLDDELLEFSCSIPSSRKLKNQDLRHFYKQALKGWLPDETINKKKQGFGLPFGVWMSEFGPLKELAYDTLGDLKKRHYFNSSFLDEAVDLHNSGHSAYYGELIWILTVLELWLSRR